MTKLRTIFAFLTVLCLLAASTTALSHDSASSRLGKSLTTDLLLFEDFEGALFPPAGWTSHNLAGDDATWALSTIVNHTPGGSNSAWHDWTATDGWLVTPPVALPDEEGFSLSFWSYNADLWAYGSNQVLVSTGSGDPADGDFAEVWTAIAPLEFTWEEIVIELDDYAGETIYIAFLKTGEWAHVWHVDDVQVGIFDPVVTYNLSFEVQDEDGNSIDNAVVTLEGVANAPGDYLFEGLMPGEYSYQVTAADYLPASGSVNIVDEDVFLTVTLAEIPLYTLTFIVEDEDGVLIDNAQIMLQNETNSPGDYVFAGLEAGVYEYTVFLEGYEIVNGTVNVSEDTTETVTLIELEVLVVSEFPFNELFGDDSETRDFWSQILVEGNALWTFGAGAGVGQPQNPYIGDLNARYVSQTGTNSPITKLVTPVFDMSELVNPRLIFYYAQHQTGVPWDPNQNQTKVYYRTALGSEWVELIHLTENIFEWTEVVLALPEHTATYQLAFEGINNGGRANVLDNVIVEDTPPSFDVTFIVEDDAGDAITNAVITLDGQTNTAGNYFFPDMETGELPYSITATNYTTVSGIINLVDENVTEHVVMSIHQESLPYFEDFAGVPNGGFPEYWTRNTTNWYVTDSKLTLWDYMYEPVVRRAYTPLIDATAMTEVAMNFNQLVWDFGGGYSLKVQTSFDGENWTDQWVWDMDQEEEVPPNDTEITLEGVEGQLFYVAFTLDGLSGDNDWQIDFLEVTGMEATDSYTVTFVVEDQFGNALEEAVVSLGDITNEPGNYVYENVEPGTYNYTVSLFCFNEASGSVVVSDNDVTVEVVLTGVPGDANGDGVVNSLDLIALASHYVGNTQENFCFNNADVNNDGEVNIIDAIMILNIFLQD